MPTSDRRFIERSARVGIIVGVAAAAALAVLWVLKAALTPLAVAFLIAYLLDPLIDRLEAGRMRRRVAILLVILVMGVFVVGGLAYVLPRLITEIAALGQQLPGYLQRAMETMIPRFEQRTGLAVPNTVEELLARLQAGEVQLPLNAVRDVLQRSLGVLTGTVSGVIGLLVVPVLAYYALVEFDTTKRRVLGLVPPRHREEVVERARMIDGLVSGFLRGQLTVAAVLGVLYAVGFQLIGIDLAIGVGLLSGVMALIPYLGNVVALGAAGTLCILEFGFEHHLLLVIGWYVVVQTFEGFFLTPRIVGSSVGLHPAVVIVALLIGADLLGFLGMLVAVPVAAVVKVFAGDVVAAYRRSNVYDDDGE